MRLFGLIGYPLGHSFSASYFNDKFKKEGLSDRYQNFPIESIEQFKDLAKSNPSLKGINVTIPYKEAFSEIMNNKNLNYLIFENFDTERMNIFFRINRNLIGNYEFENR